MSQNRPPPAYMEYAAAMLSDIRFRLMSPAERGVLYTIRLECWVNNGVPSDPTILAKILGFDSVLIASSLPAVLKFLERNGDLLVCPDLEDYRAHLKGVREKQAAGGRLGAATTNGKTKSPRARTKQGEPSNTASNPTSYPHGTRPTTCESSYQIKPDQHNQNQSLEEGGWDDSTSEWLDSHQKAEQEQYEKASKGF